MTGGGDFDERARRLYERAIAARLTYQKRPIPWAAWFAAHLREGLPESKRGKVVIAVAVYTDADGERHPVVATSDTDGQILEPVWRRMAGDEELPNIPGRGVHAETRVLTYLDELRNVDPRITIDVLAVSDPVCAPCDEAIRQRGIYCPTKRQTQGPPRPDYGDGAGGLSPPGPRGKPSGGPKWRP